MEQRYLVHNYSSTDGSLGDIMISALRKYIRQKLILESRGEQECLRSTYWGVGGSGVVVLCTEDKTIYMQKRSMRVSGGRGQWGFPGGGIHPFPDYEDYYDTPIEEKYRLSPDDPDLIKKAFEEFREEACYNGMPKYKVLESFISYEDCGFIYNTVIIDIPLVEKHTWIPEPYPWHAWESTGSDWFHASEWKKQNIFFGFTPSLKSKIDGYLS